VAQCVAALVPERERVAVKSSPSQVVRVRVRVTTRVKIRIGVTFRVRP